MSRMLARLEDFRLPPVYVVVSMAIGIAIGNVFLFTLIVMFALKGDLILKRPQIVLDLAVPMAIFFFSVFTVAYLVSSRLGFA